MPPRQGAVRALVVLVAAGGLLGGCAHAGPTGGDRPSTTPTPSQVPTKSAAGVSSSETSAEVAMPALVDRVDEALAHGRLPAPAVLTAGPGRDDLAARLAGMRAARVEGLSLAVEPGSVRVDGGQATATVTGTTRIGDAWPGGFPLSFTARGVRTSDGWRLVTFADDGTQPWDLRGLRRLDVDGIVALGNVSQADLRWYATAAAQALRDDARVWSGVPAGRPVLVVPGTSREFARQVGRASAVTDQLAAMTVGVLAAGRTAQGDRVVVNPAIKSRLTDEGRRTILRHELVHVLIRGTTTGTVPQWLTEGYATQGSWTHGPPQQLRARARAWTPAQRSAREVPSDDEVERTDVAHAYDVSAVLVDDLVARHGRARVEAFYRLMASGADRDRAARAALGESFAAVIGHWHAAMDRVAGA